MGTHFQRFTRPDTLSRISPRLMLALLDAHRDALLSCGFAVPDREDDLDVAALAGVLQSGLDTVPHSLLDVLWSVHELHHATDAVQTAVLDNGADPGLLLGMSVEDMVVWLSLNAKDALRRLLAERASCRPRSFTAYLAAYSAELFCQGRTDAKMRAIGVVLDEALRSHHRGPRVSEHLFEKDSCIEIVFGFGGSLSRIAAADEAAIGSVTYRPLEHVVLRIDRSLRLLSISNQPDWLRRALRGAAGDAFFGDAEHFDDGQPVYTLAPLLSDGVRALACSDIPDLQSVTLVELQYEKPGKHAHTVLHKANDLRSLLTELPHEGVRACHLLQAKLKVLCRGESRPRSIVIKEGNCASFARDDDRHLVDRFMIARGFMAGKQHASRKSA